MQKIAAQLSFYVGLFLMILGSVILFAANAGISRIAVLPASFALAIGAAFAVLAIRLDKKAQYLFLAALFIQIGLLLLLLALGVFPVLFREVWPVLSVFAGISLLIASANRKNKGSYNYLVPAMVFILLGLIFLLFSLDLLPVSFRRFFLSYWPVLALMSGILLMLLSSGHKRKEKEQGP